MESAAAGPILPSRPDTAAGPSRSGRRTARGGRDFAAGLLEAPFGADKAAGLMDRLASTMAGKSFEFLELMAPQQILELIDGELPQTIALVLAHLRPTKASAVASGLDDDPASEVARCIATMGPVAPDVVPSSLRF